MASALIKPAPTAAGPKPSIGCALVVIALSTCAGVADRSAP